MYLLGLVPVGLGCSMVFLGLEYVHHQESGTKSYFYTKTIEMGQCGRTRIEQGLFRGERDSVMIKNSV